MQQCKICNSKSHFLFQSEVLGKYNVSYYRCEHCGFIQTEEPYWLAEAYSSVITSQDIGYVMRNLMYSNVVPNFLFINNQFNINNKFIDYGGGYGMFVRMMRDKGFDFYRADKFCDNLFARHFDVTDIPPESRRFEMLTCFEVFEHLANPLAEIEEMLKYSNSIFFSTELVPQKELKSADDWWYFGPEHGQHIAFYTRKSLELIAERFGLNFYTNGQSTHLFTDKTLEKDCLCPPPVKTTIFRRVVRRMRRIFPEKKKQIQTTRQSLLGHDVQHIQSILKQK